MEIRRVHHLTIAVRDVVQASATFSTLFDASDGRAFDTPAFGIKGMDSEIAGLTLQFVSPAEADSAVARFIERRGEGLYNIAFEVPDLDDALAELRGRGVRVSDPVEATPGTRSAFVAMAATHGVSVQLIEAPRSVEDAPPEAPPSEWKRPAPEPAPPAGEEAAPPVRDLRPDEWEEWSDTD